jgi:hypothetical protein
MAAVMLGFMWRMYSGMVAKVAVLTGGSWSPVLCST